MSVLRDMQAYFRTTHKTAIEVFYQPFGRPGMFQVTMDFDNLTALEAVSQKMARDPEYRALADRARRVMVEDSFSTAVYHHIPLAGEARG